MPTLRPDQIIRSDRKTLAISIDPFGRLIVRAPKRCEMERVFAFLKEKEGWILRKKAERAGAGIDLPGNNLDGYTFFLLGERYEIRLYKEKKVGIDTENKKVYLPTANPRETLVKWLKTNAKRIFSNLTEKTATRMGVLYKSVAVTSARGRWGSCSYNNAVHYSFRLLYAPKEVIEYVIVHELAHIKHKNHSPAFWAEVEEYVPDWKEKRAWLKRYAALMEIF